MPHLLFGDRYSLFCDEAGDLLPEEGDVGSPLLVVVLRQRLVQQVLADSSGQKSQVLELDLTAVVTEPDGNFVLLHETIFIILVEDFKLD